MESLPIFYTKMWTREATSCLIQHYKANECLWMTTAPLYRNKNKRTQALHQIAIEVSKYRSQSTAEDIKNKINGIRTQYVSEINKLILANNNGEQYEPTLWCFEILSFLKPYTQPKQRPPNNMNSWNRNVMQRPYRPSFNQKIQQSSAQLSPNNRHFESHIFNDEQKKDCILVKNEPEQEIEDDIEIIEEEDTLITDEEYGSPAYHHEEEKQAKDDAEEQTSTSYKQQFPAFIDSATEESSDEQRVRRLLSPSRINAEITLVPKKELLKRKDDLQESGLEEKKRRIEEFKKEEEKEDRINIFGKFVMSQMRTVTDHVLLIKLEHTIQNAIIEAQLKQIEMDEKKNLKASENQD